MLRRLNSTGRRRIEATRVGIRLSAAEAGVFTTTLDLQNLGLPSDAAVVVEAQRLSSVERFALGQVSALAEAHRSELRELTADDTLQFRVKVVEPATGRLLALAKQIKPGDADESGRLSLMTVKEKDLGFEPWRVEIEGDEVVLALNQRIPDAIAAFAKAGSWRALVLAAAFRQVLLQLWAERKQAEEDGELWHARWLQFAETLVDREWEGGDDARDWIDDACSAFSERHALITPLIAGEAS